jgi:DNA-binding transcriptional MerR regulator
MATKIKHDQADWHSASRAAKLSGLSASMLNYLCRERIVEPSCSCPRGHGIPRHYSFGDLVALRLVGQLSKVGASPLRLRAALKGLRKHHPEITLTSLPASHIATDGKHLMLCREGEAIERLVDGQMAFAFVIELAPLQAAVARQLKRA